MADLKSDDTFRGVLAEERRQIALARGARGGDSKKDPSSLVGLALSSGGIRSATFCLGVLQGLATAGLLRGIDYLSCVGGGGYIGGRIAAMIAREGFEHTNEALARDQIWLPNAPSTRFFLHSAIGFLGLRITASRNNRQSRCGRRYP
jgi:predicted acylesterase/phospholipase RssA